MTLSDKRKELRFQAFENGIGESEIFRILEEQDKQFIKDLKEHRKIKGWETVSIKTLYMIINELAGEDLI